MAAQTPISIDHSDEFEHLNRAPIVEAVIQIVARAGAKRTLGELRTSLSSELPEYPHIKSVGSVSVTMPFQLASKQGAPAPEPATSERSWLGLRLETEGGLNIAMFTRDYFSFSRLRPYEDWESFQTEALRLWSIHYRLAEPSEVRRVGVRFINRFDVPAVELDPGEYLSGLAEPPGDLQRSGYFYRDDLIVPGHPYNVTLMRTVQPSGVSQPSKVGLLLDIDVFSNRPFAPEQRTIERRLLDMHWLKNHVFFKNATEKALSLCR
jgi:uncharacterized protein (TIGR04255 family)